MDEKIILAIVNKQQMFVDAIYVAKPIDVVKRLREKLEIKNKKHELKEKEIRRITASLSKGDLSKINATKISFNN